ncbi:MAG: metalloregulator ArsR/SmtB family transcription factor [Candidatus Eisenbacteria bacterium]
MPNKNPKQRLYSELTRVAKALSSPGRLELIELLAQGECTVEVLARGAGLSIANASHHLQVLREARLVEARKEGQYVHYRLAGPDVFGLFRTLRSVGGRRLAEVDQILQTYLRTRDVLEPVGRRDLLKRAEEGTVIVLDVRPPEEYRAGHIPGAISVPVEKLGARLADLPRGKEIVAYCRGPYCVMAFDAVKVLRAHGRKARRLEDGFPEWRAAGLPVAAGAEETEGVSRRATRGRRGSR